MVMNGTMIQRKEEFGGIGKFSGGISLMSQRLGARR